MTSLGHLAADFKEKTWHTRIEEKTMSCYVWMYRSRIHACCWLIVKLRKFVPKSLGDFEHLDESAPMPKHRVRWQDWQPTASSPAPVRHSYPVSYSMAYSQGAHFKSIWQIHGNIISKCLNAAWLSHSTSFLTISTTITMQAAERNSLSMSLILKA